MPDADPASTPRPPRLFWGWWIFLGALTGQFVTVGFGLQVTGVFLEPMTEALGWTRSQFVLAGALGFAVGGSPRSSWVRSSIATARGR